MLHLNSVPEHVRQMLRQAETFYFDVDGTLVERQATLMPDFALQLIKIGKQNGVATSRASDEFEEIFAHGLSLEDVVSAPVILEDGCVVLNPQDREIQLCAPENACELVFDFVEKIERHLTSIPFEEQWVMLNEREDLRVHVPKYYAYKASSSVWIDVSDGTHIIEEIFNWHKTLLQKCGLEAQLDLTEIGDGTVRIAIPNRSKGVALKELHDAGKIDLSKTVYFGDGNNDVAAAKEVRKAGGAVIVANSRCSELLKHGNFKTRMPGPQGIMELLQQVFPGQA